MTLSVGIVAPSLLLASLLIVAACSDSSGGPGGSVGPPGSSGGSGTDTGPDGSTDTGRNAEDSGGPDGGPPGPPSEPGIGYLKGSGMGWVEALYYDPAAGKSASLVMVNNPRELRRPLRGGRPFALLRGVTNLPTVFKGYSGKNGAATPALTLSPKSASSPKMSVDVDTAGAAYYAGELDQRGFVDFFKDGVRLSHGPGRVATQSAGTSTSVSLVDARGGAVAWSLGVGIDAKLVLLWPGQSAEEQLEGAADYLRGFAAESSFSPSGRCFAFRAKLLSPTAQVGLGVRCNGEPTRVPALASGVTIADARDSVLWHPSLDRLAAIDFWSGSKSACVASRTGATWSLEHVALPAEAKTAAAIALAPDGSELYVVAEESTGPTRLFAVSFGGATATPSQARPIALGTHLAVSMAGFSAFDRSLAVIRGDYGSSGEEVVLVAPDGTTKSVFSTTGGIIRDVRWAPSGRSLVVRVSGGLPPFDPETGDLYLVDAAGGTPRKLNEAGQVVKAMKWSDTSEHVGFIADEGGITGRLYVAKAAGGPLGAAIDEGVTEFLSDPPLPTW